MWAARRARAAPFSAEGHRRSLLRMTNDRAHWERLWAKTLRAHPDRARLRYEMRLEARSVSSSSISAELNEKAPVVRSNPLLGDASGIIEAENVDEVEGDPFPVRRYRPGR
jgi:hypothetical protein